LETSEILAAIDREINQLKQARALLEGRAAPALGKRPGRPKKAAVDVASAAKKPVKKKRNLSPDGRARIVEAVKRRWVAQKKAAATK
jgi:hypothetical protein